MDSNDKDKLAKLVCYAFGCLVAYYILMAILPYVVGILALCGFGYLYQEYQRNHRNRH